MNTLELKGELYAPEVNDSSWFVIALLVDGEPIVDFHCYSIFLAELKRSLVGSGTCFILTCTCGFPECAGIHEGVNVVHKEKIVEWTVVQPRPQRTFSFDSAAYEHAVTYGIEQIKRDVAFLWFTKSGRKNQKLEIGSGREEDLALLEPKPRVCRKNRHRNS